MKIFYIFWFMFCGLFGFGLAGFPASHGPGTIELVLVFPLSLLSGVALFWLTVRGARSGQFAQQPSLSLKPWTRPTGCYLFGALTLVFASSWSVALALVAHLPGLRLSIFYFLMGAGTLASIFLCRRLFPQKFLA